MSNIVKTEPCRVAFWPNGAWCELDETRDFEQMAAECDDYFIREVTLWNADDGSPHESYF